MTEQENDASVVDDKIKLLRQLEEVTEGQLENTRQLQKKIEKRLRVECAVIQLAIFLSIVIFGYCVINGWANSQVYSIYLIIDAIILCNLRWVIKRLFG